MTRCVLVSITFRGIESIARVNYDSVIRRSFCSCKKLIVTQICVVEC